MAALARSLWQGVRQLARQPAFSVAAIGSLAIGIGLTTALFSAVNAVLLRKTPIERTDRLVEIYAGVRDYPHLTTAYPDYKAIREGADAFERVAAHAFVRAIVSTGGRPRLVTGETVSANYFDVLGVVPARGRGFAPGEDRVAGVTPVVVVSHGVWQRQLGGRADILGSTLVLSGRPYTVIGVAPRRFTGTMPGVSTDFWVPVTMVDRFAFAGVQWSADDPWAPRLERRGLRWLFVKGRLAEGRDIDQARSQIAAIYDRLRAAHPDIYRLVQPSVAPAAGIRYHPMVDGSVAAASGASLVAAGLVLLIACANVANLLLARGSTRQRELAIRAALGAGRGRLVRQLLGESVVLAIAGGTAGTAIAWWASRAASGFGVEVFPVPIGFEVALDGTVLAFAAGVTALSALLFGLAPAWTASRLDLVSALSGAGARGPGRPARRVPVRDTLVVVQLSLSLVLLVSGALLARGLLAARGADVGFDAEAVTSLAFDLEMNGYDLDRAATFRERAFEALRGQPGVEAVSYASRVPLSPDMMVEGVRVPGHHRPDDAPTPIDAVSVGVDYFRTVGVSIVEGRAFSVDEMTGQRRVAIVNQAMARRYWPNGKAVGQVIHLGGIDQPPHEVVGVAGDHAVRAVGEPPRPYLHLPAGPTPAMGIVVRTRQRAATALPMLREALWRLEPDIVFTEDASAAAIAATTRAPTRLGAALLGSFGMTALLLAAVGLYGVITCSVSRRTRDVGIRVALGASRAQILRLVLRDGRRLAVAGMAVGTLAALGCGRALASLLYGVSPFDPVAHGIASAILLTVAGVANLVPALAAARVDPLRALTHE